MLMSERKSKLSRYDEVPYKVLAPGQHRHYPLRSYKDPRIGTAQRVKDAFYKRRNLPPDDHDDETSDESEDEDKYANVPTVVISTTIKCPKNTRTRVRSKPLPPLELEKYFRALKKPYKLRVKNEAKMLKIRDCECAEEAITFYNNQHATDYEIVETLGSYFTCYIGFWYHCNFRAQSKSDIHSLPKLFFAELFRKGPHKRAVNVCNILDGPDSPETDVGCKFCRHLLHPVNGFKVGRVEDK